MLQARASEGLAQDQYVAARVGLEPATFRTKGTEPYHIPCLCTKHSASGYIYADDVQVYVPGPCPNQTCSFSIYFLLSQSLLVSIPEYHQIVFHLTLQIISQIQLTQPGARHNCSKVTSLCFPSGSLSLLF